MSSTPEDETSSGSGPVIRDRRRLDPQTGRLRDAYAGQEPSGPSGAQPTGQPAAGQPASTGAEGGANGGRQEQPDAGASGPDQAPSLDGVLADLDAAQASAAERLADLQRLQAEFVNYRRRVERDRDVARDQAVATVLEAMLPVLDDVHLARQHGDLDGGPFSAIAEKLEGTLGRFGLSRYGELGEPFDPEVHEALMRTEAEVPEGATTTTVVAVLQPGYRTGERVLRAARVAVADPS